jgi:hypothetical protein
MDADNRSAEAEPHRLARLCVAIAIIVSLSGATRAVGQQAGAAATKPAPASGPLDRPAIRRAVDVWKPLSEDVMFRVVRRVWGFDVPAADRQGPLAELSRLADARQTDGLTQVVEHAVDGVLPQVFRSTVVQREGVTMRQAEEGVFECELWSPAFACSVRRLNTRDSARQLSIVEPERALAGDGPFHALTPLPVLEGHRRLLEELAWTRLESPQADRKLFECRAENGTVFRFRVRASDGLPLAASRWGADRGWFAHVEVEYGPTVAGPVWVKAVRSISITRESVRIVDRHLTDVVLGVLAEHQRFTLDGATPVYDFRGGRDRYLGSFASVRDALPHDIGHYFEIRGSDGRDR